ncbi:ABC transporter ATP-binding protein [Saezia sanguinis]|uniref:ABC transporter ATP-binding protein n=1 Tax=Saezia sanguinis TaxID=1965230 RepID=UPI00302E710C
MKDKEQDMQNISLPKEGRPLLSVRDLTVRWGARAAVEQVCLDIAAGEKVALVGESGSGKSVTAMSFLGLLSGAQVSGTSVFTLKNGQQLDLNQATERQLERIRGKEIAMIFQEPMTALDPLFTVGDQIVEGLQLHEGLSRQVAWKRAIELLDRTGITEPQERAFSYPHQLSGGQRQRAMIAMALACGPRLLLADEPTTALDVTLRVQIMDLLNRLQQEDGMAVLLISHDLGIVRHFADRMAVMEKGAIVETGETQKVFSQPKHPYTQRLLDSRPQRLVGDEDAHSSSGTTPVVQAEQVKVFYPGNKPAKGKGLARLAFWRRQPFEAVDGVTLSLAPGRTLGIIGESGSGKSTLAMALLGLLPHGQVQGDIAINGKAWGSSLAQERPMRAHIQVVFQDPFSSLSPRMTVRDIVAEGLLVHQPQCTRAQRDEKVAQALADVGLSADIMSRYPHEFSGGQRQRIAIARALIVGPSILVLDEPTSALDVSIQKQVLELLAQLQQDKQLSYILITHDVGVVRALAHEVIVMKSGKIVEAGTVEQIMTTPAMPYTQALISAAMNVE